MKRRDVLCSAVLIPAAGLAKAMPASVEGALAEVGRAAIADGVVPADREILQSALGLSSHDVTPLAGQINDLVVADFAAGDSVNVAGWVLSRTEARICALVALGGQIGA